MSLDIAISVHQVYKYKFNAGQSDSYQMHTCKCADNEL